nr:RNA polymerase sigma-70 factor [uncultured Dyadobacter sp.]
MNTLLKEAPSDRQLLHEFQQGSELAFKAIYNRYFPRLYLHALKMLRDPDDAQDLVQELFTAFWIKGRELDLTTSLSAYLYASTRNRVLNIFEHNRVHDHYIVSLGQYLSTVESSVDELVIEQELTEIIEAEIRRMPPRMREIFEFSRHDNLSHREIAEILSISDKTVKKQVSKALKILKLKISYGILLIEAYAQFLY